MIEVRQTEVFADWFRRLRDQRARARIIGRLDRVVLGNLGDHRSIGEGVFELKIDYGPGYRVYFARRANTVVILLCGGDKSTQDRDIRKAQALARELET